MNCIWNGRVKGSGSIMHQADLAEGCNKSRGDRGEVTTDGDGPSYMSHDHVDHKGRQWLETEIVPQHRLG